MQLVHDRILRSLVIVAVTLPGVAACERGDAESTVASLDNFASASGAAETRNSCEPRFEGLAADELDVIETRGGDRKLEAEVARALAAVPPSLRKVFVGLGGRITLTTRAPAICGSPNSCWRLSEDGRPVIYLTPTTAAVRHATVRAFGYLLSQMIVKVEVENGKPRYAPENERFDAAKRRILTALERDIDRSRGRYTRSALDRLAGDERGDFAFAEAFDSYYCSRETRATMVRDFGETHRAFAAIARELEGPSSELALSIDFFGILGSLFNMFTGGGGASGGGGGAGGGGLMSIISTLLPLLTGGSI